MSVRHFSPEEERRILSTPGVQEGIEQSERDLEAAGYRLTYREDEELAEADMAAGFETLPPEPCGEPGCCRLRGNDGPTCIRRRRP